ncbi:MAG: hypothetical protein WCV67_16490 [Victivallaceae bacterium]|jgi:hypothetical protein
MSDFCDLWTKIIEIHNYTKGLFLWAEEIDPELKLFNQPNNELRNALEHIIRFKAGELGLTPNGDGDTEDYSAKSLDKALGHEYRAFFDTADWFSITLREKIINSLAPYSISCIKEVLPDYYSRDRAAIDKICKDIAKIRDSKDVDRKNEVLREVTDYYAQISKLYEIWETIRDKEPSLNECSMKLFKESVWRNALTVLIGIIVGFALRTIFKKP